MASMSTVPQAGGLPSVPSYDLFIVHADADRAWVDGYLRHALGLDPARVVTRRDIRLGESVPAEFDRLVTSSRFTLLVLSPAFLADRWAEFGEGLVTFSSVDEGRNRLIGLKRHDCPLPLHLRFKESLDCTTGTIGTTRPRGSVATWTPPIRSSRPSRALTPAWSHSQKKMPASSTAATMRSRTS